MRTTPILATAALALALTACGAGGGPAPLADDKPDTETEAADAGTEAGTRDNPYNAGDSIDLGDWTITLAATNLDATAEVEAANSLNEIPEGQTAIMVEVEATYTGDDSSTVWIDVGIEYIGGDGNTYDSTNAYCGPVDNSLLQVREQYTDATVTGTVCVTIPDGAEDGTWKLERRGINGAEAFVGLD